MNYKYSSIAWLLFLVLLIAVLTSLGPAEKTLGVNARIVYLHGVWVWTALACFFTSALAGIAGWIGNNISAHYWSRALGRTGLLFWITYLPLSIWAMQANWNGLFLAEPRWRLALIFATGGLLVQLGITLIGVPAWASLANTIFILILMLALQTTDNVMHPPSPILDSNAPRIQAFFFALFFLMVLSAWQIACWWRKLEPSNPIENHPNSLKN